MEPQASAPGAIQSGTQLFGESARTAEPDFGFAQTVVSGGKMLGGQGASGLAVMDVKRDARRSPWSALAMVKG